MAERDEAVAKNGGGIANKGSTNWRAKTGKRVVSAETIYLWPAKIGEE